MESQWHRIQFLESNSFFSMNALFEIKLYAPVHTGLARKSCRNGSRFTRLRLDYNPTDQITKLTIDVDQISIFL